MKRSLNFLLLFFVLTVIVTSCGTRQNGQVIGVLDRPVWKGINPYGMVYIPSGTLHIGPSDQDITNTFVQRPRTISIQGFYMDDTEITNNEWRQFVYWVRDSIAHAYMDHYYEDEDDATSRARFFRDRKKQLKEKPEQLQLAPFIKPIAN